VRKTRGKYKQTALGLAKWIARGVTVAEWRELPIAAKAFLSAVIQLVSRVN